MKAPVYLYLKPGDTPPSLEGANPFKAVVVIESSDVTPAWRKEISSWLVRNGCLYMMAWGHDCGAWDDSVDWAALEKFDFEDIPDDRFVMTTWHEEDTLQETFWFSENTAVHPTVELKATYILHIASVERAESILKVFRAAQEELS